MPDRDHADTEGADTEGIAPSPAQLAWSDKVLGLIGERPANGGSTAAAPRAAAAEMAAETARLAALPAEELIGTDLTAPGTDRLFRSAYTASLQDAPTKGAGDPDLKALMREVDRGVSGPRRVEVMEGLARIVGIPPTAAALELDYARFLVIRKQQAAVAAGKEMTVPGLDEDKHPEFMASRGQLLCGQVLGDAFGIHQVFAALLTPTGGLVGPGNWLIPGVVKAGHLDWDNPVALHGTVHDAAGYLLVFHGQGPGYNYRDSPIELLKTESPLSGQISGIAYWVWEAGDDYLRRRIAAAVMAVERGLREVRSKVAAGIDGLLGRLRALAGGGDAGAPGGPGDPLETAEAILDAQERAERCAVEPSAESGTPPDTPPATRLRDRARARLKAAWSVLRG